MSSGVLDWWRRTMAPTQSAEPAMAGGGNLDLDETPDPDQKATVAVSGGGSLGLTGRRPAPKHRATRSR